MKPKRKPKKSDNPWPEYERRKAEIISTDPNRKEYELKINTLISEMRI